MKCLLYIPQYECDGVHGKYTANVRIGGLTIYERACRSIQAAKFDEIIVAKFDALEVKPDPLIKIGVKSFDFKSSPDEISTSLIDAIGSENIAVCVLDAMVSASCFAMRPVGADVRITVGQTQTGIYFLRNDSAIELLKTPHGLDKIESTVSDTYAAPDTALYHKILTKEDTKTGQNLLTKSLRKPLGRDADGLVAYFINRPCSLQISKRIANSPITPNMITAIGLVIGLAAAALVALGNQTAMIVTVILWQISSMVDGIDGELARMRLSPSHRGEWFDTIADDITNITFMLGLGHGLYMLGEDFPFLGHHSSIYYFYIAIVVCSLMVISVGWFYALFVKLGIASHNHFEWGFEADNKSNKSEEKRGFVKRIAEAIAGGFAWIAKRDFYTFLIMVLVICHLNKTAYFIMLTGASFVGIGGIIALTLRTIRSCFKKKNSSATNM